MYKTAQILVVGSEFFTRDKVDSNSIWLTEELEKRGVRVLSKSVVADDLPTLVRAIRQGLSSADLVISTGGLGPTEDDRTREAAAEALEVELEFREDLAQEIAQLFASRGRVMSENNRRQAYIPASSLPLTNPMGTAPGFFYEGSVSTFVALPGPPNEMKAMFSRFTSHVDNLFASGQTCIYRRTLRVAGLGESDMDRKIADLYAHVANPEVTINFTLEDLEIHLTSKAATLSDAQALADNMVQVMKERLGEHLFSDDDQSLAEVVVNLLRQANLKLAAAESITGGYLAHKLCSVPGASEVFLGSLVTYTNVAKKQWLQVSTEDIDNYGPVSEEVAGAMLKGLLEQSSADLALVCTGFAGPSGGNEANPVGTAFLGFSHPEGQRVQRLTFPGDRNAVRVRVAQAMLFMLYRYLCQQKTTVQN